ncbi:MAG TPA: methyltransferase domain-containing protein [Candidatus Polarisedimenticolia bacterium]|nr:methyltransferase domain-containing protein [Candidatus Polarisedimenticolia bacterium]
MKIFRKPLPSGFDTPTALPRDEQDASAWQGANRRWWEAHPMRYEWGGRNPHPEGSREFFREMDARFFEGLSTFLPWKSRPFDPLIDFEHLGTRDVLEIGVGGGSVAQLLAGGARSFAGIDLTDHAVRLTRRRFAAFGLGGRVLRMDAERLAFGPESFDSIWTWGVIHHTANTRRVLEEMHRVLRPGGRATVMVYHRSFLNYYIGAGLCEGVLGGGFLRNRSLNAQMQNRWDGALARFYTRAEWAREVEGLFAIERQFVCGQPSEVVPLDIDLLRYAASLVTPLAVSRFVTNTCSQGSFLVSQLLRV